MATDREFVVALHCSGAGAGQWRQLTEYLGDKYEVVAPEHYGCERTGQWCGTHAFTLADEAQRTFELIDQRESKVHLVGHSYGAGVALHVALARPARIASLSLYEPSAFHLLKKITEGAAAFAEISAVARKTGESVVIGDYQAAARTFVDYWGGVGAWKALKPAVQTALIGWIPKAPLDFRALIEEPTDLTAFASLHFPVLIMRGEHAPLPTRQIAEALACLMLRAQLIVVNGAGHMGPITQTPVVSRLMADHIKGRPEQNAAGARYAECAQYLQRLA